jgi:D-alanyl-D-alanine dipeptidase
MMNKNFFYLVPLLLMGVISVVSATTVGESLQTVSTSINYIEVKSTDAIALELRYATTNNFTGQNLYGVFNHAYLQKSAAEKLIRAAANLKMVQPKYKLLIFDVLRPRSVQHLLWNKVKGTDQQKYVANPQTGSIHNYGFAVDLSIVDESGKELDMGTAFDDFTALAQPAQEEKFLESGKLTQQQLQNRRLLRKAMEDAGFIQLSLEWWHFDALPKAEVKKNYSIVE